MAPDAGADEAIAAAVGGLPASTKFVVCDVVSESAAHARRSLS